MSDLVAFLRARLDEDEAAAKVVLQDPDYRAEWHEQSSGVLYIGPGSERYPLDGLQPLGDSRLARFIASHDPARALREVEAKRAILDAYAENDGDVDLHLGPYPRKHGEWDGLRLAVRHLAAVYSDHPDYQQDWKP